MGIIDSSIEPPREKSNLVRNLVALAVLVLVLFAIGIAISRIQEHRLASANEDMVRTARQLGSKIETSHVYFNTGENFLGDYVRYLNGMLTNRHDRPLERIELTFTFVNSIGQTVLRESKQPIDEHKASLKPGESREFAVGFEKLPADWNHQHPAIQITRLKFAN
jgi:hypothetical protein